MPLQKILATSFILLGFFLSTQNIAHAFDDTTCLVRIEDDRLSNPLFWSLRRSVDNFNRNHIPGLPQLCKEEISITHEVESVILAGTLSIDNPEDTDCEADHELCADGYGFILGGEDDHIVTLDIRDLDPSQCAININTPLVLLKNMDILATEAQVSSERVFCSQEDTDFENVTINGEAYPPEPKSWNPPIQLRETYRYFLRSHITYPNLKPMIR